MSNTKVRTNRQVRFVDFESYLWLTTKAPNRWLDNVRLHFDLVRLSSLEAADSPRESAVVANWLERIRDGRPVPPPIVSKTDHGTYYVHDGNHRLDALREYSQNATEMSVRVAIAVPGSGYRFQYRRSRGLCTCTLEPSVPRLHSREHTRVQPACSQLPDRILVLAAHPDDETGGCSGLLQRIREPLVFFATEGSPADDFFWRRFGSQQSYALVRRHEAAAALAAIGVKTLGFLGDWVDGGIRLQDQELFKFLPLALQAISTVVERFKPEVVIVPAYEGGHPDHDACSFLGFALRRFRGVDVWEMPLYHRSEQGSLVNRRFRAENGTESSITLTSREMLRRTHMVMQYSSQRDLSEFAAGPLEYFRPQADYDYSKPPHSGLLNYQVWQWPISPLKVCEEFMRTSQKVDSILLSEAK